MVIRKDKNQITNKKFEKSNTKYENTNNKNRRI